MRSRFPLALFALFLAFRPSVIGVDELHDRVADYHRFTRSTMMRIMVSVSHRV